MMANREQNNTSPPFIARITKRYVGEGMYSSSSSSDEVEVTPECRIGGDETGQGNARRDKNPFSFKRFLKNGTQANYYNAGARPKVYSSLTPSQNNLEKDTGVYSRNPTELPDFVQDHLVIEQCYLNHESNQQTIPDVDNLPDFALNSVEQRQTRLRNDSKKCDSAVLCDLPFDLTGSLDKRLLHKDHSSPNAACSAHLDLPVFDRSNVQPAERSESSGFPLDLPLPPTESDPSPNSVRECSAASETNVPKSLPDFLSDGPIHNRTTLSTDPGSSSSTAESTERRLLLENERLRQELELARKQIYEKSKRIHLLESDLVSKRDVDHEETAQLEKAMEQVEDNLKRSTKRAVSAESTVTSLKKEIKSLTTEISLLQLENRELRACVAATNRNEYGTSNMNQTIRRLAGDLRNAASTAEVSLRQLMSGVDNLRMLASALENVDRIEDRTKDFLPDFDEDNATGPAL